MCPVSFSLTGEPLPPLTSRYTCRSRSLTASRVDTDKGIEGLLNQGMIGVCPFGTMTWLTVLQEYNPAMLFGASLERDPIR